MLAPQAEPPAGTSADGSPDTSERLLLPGEVSAMFRVSVSAVRRWGSRGYLTEVRTLGGHRRYRESEVRALLDGGDAGGQALAGDNEADTD